MALPTPTVIYYLDLNAFHTTYGVYVSGTRNLLDLPKMKDPIRVSYPDQPGEVVDLSSPQFEPREFTIDCWIQATSVLDFATKLKTFINAFIAVIATGTHRLRIEIDSATSLVYQVYLQDGVAANVKFKKTEQIGTFTLKLREPEPVKKIYKFTAPPSILGITILATKRMNIYWGDNTMSADVAANGAVVNHTYGTTGLKWIVITGDVDTITYINTAATLVWDKLL